MSKFFNWQDSYVICLFLNLPVYINIFKPPIPFFFLTYVYLYLLSNRFQVFYPFGLRMGLFFWTFLFMLWLFKLCLLAKQGDKVCFGLFWLPTIYTFSVVWFCVFFILFLLDKTFEKCLENVICFFLFLFVINTLCLFFWVFIKKAVLFLVLHFLLLIFNFFVVNN